MSDTTELTERVESGKTVLALDSQILNSIQLCPYRTMLEYLEHYTALHAPAYYEKGDIMHQLLAHYYEALRKGRTDRRDFIEEAVRNVRQATVGMDLSDSEVELAIQNIRAYFEYYENDGWKPLEIERPFSKILFEDEKYRVIYEGRIDLVVDAPEGIRIVDHKSASIRKQPISLSNQFMGYSWAIDQPTVVVNKIGTQKTLGPRERFNRYRFRYEADRIMEWYANSVWWVKQLIYHIEQDMWPKNFTSCDKYSGCIFVPICESIPQVREWKLESQFKVREIPWSPYNQSNEERDLTALPGFEATE